MRSPLRQAAIAFALVSVTLAIATPIAAKVTVTICGPGCICIDYTKGASSHIEVRCTSGGGEGGGGDGGWTTIEPGPNGPVPEGPGSFGGDGDPGDPIDPHPCDPVPAGPLGQRLEQAKTWANNRLSWVGPPENRRPTTCTHLFRNSPLGLAGKTLLDENAPFHVIFRKGEDCTLPNGQSSPCSASIQAFTTCCNHSPYVYLCDSFADYSHTDSGIRLIHELLHVAGQREDASTTTGPGNPPTTNQLNDLVREACLSPEVIPEP